MSTGTKFIAGSQVSSTKTMDQKSRFGELCTEERQEIMDKAIPETTKKLQSSE